MDQAKKGKMNAEEHLTLKEIRDYLNAIATHTEIIAECLKK